MMTATVDRWLPTRAARALQSAGIQTLADHTVRVPRRRRWWAAVPSLGARSARQIEEFFAAHPALTERARALVVVPQTAIAPWEHLVVPQAIDGSRGLPGAAGHLHPPLVTTTRQSRPGWVCGRSGDPARLPHRSGAADAVGDPRARQGAVIADDRRCRGVPRLLAWPIAAGALGRPGAAAHVRGMAPFPGTAGAALRRLCTVRDRSAVSLADRAPLYAGQPLRRRASRGNGPWRRP